MAAGGEGIQALGPPEPKREFKVILVSVPCADRVPRLTLRLTTTWRRLRSAALLSDGAAGSPTNTKSSLMWRSMRRHSLAWAAAQSSRKGRPMASRPVLRPRHAAAVPWDGRRLWPQRRARGRLRPTGPAGRHRGRGPAGRGCPAAGGPSTAVRRRRNGGRRRRNRRPAPPRTRRRGLHPPPTCLGHAAGSSGRWAC